RIGQLVLDEPITAAGVPLTATEGTPFLGTVASFRDPDAFATAAEYTATIDWGDGALTAVLITQPGGPGTPFQVYGSHTYAGAAPRRGAVTIQDTDTALNRATVTSLLTVLDAALTAVGTGGRAKPGKAFRRVVASFADANGSATAGDFTAVIHWGD